MGIDELRWDLSMGTFDKEVNECLPCGSSGMLLLAKFDFGSVPGLKKCFHSEFCAAFWKLTCYLFRSYHFGLLIDNVLLVETTRTLTPPQSTGDHRWNTSDHRWRQFWIISH